MEFDGFLGLVGLLAHWRVVLCIAGSGLAALLLVHFFPWFTGLQGIAFTALGLLPGVIWEETAHPSPGRQANQRTSTFVAALAAISFGALWGAVSSTNLHSAVAGGVVLAGVSWAWFRYAVALQAWLSREQGGLCNVVATLAYLASALIAHNAA